MKAVIIGNGSMGRRRIRHCRMLGIEEVLGFDLRPDRREAAAGEFGIRTLATVEELVTSGPDVAFISVPPAEHRWYIDLAIRHGWDFMVEQPVLHSLEGSDDLVERVEARGLVTHVSCNKRYHPIVRLMREVVHSGAIGPVVTGIVETGEWLPDWHPYEPYTDYYPSRRDMGGGLDLVCELEWVRNIFGPVERMLCLAAKRTSLAIDTDDVVQLITEFASGPQIVFHADMVQRAYAFHSKFVGEKGTLVWDWADHRLKLYEAGAREWTTLGEEPDLTGWPTLRMKPGWEWVEPMYHTGTQTFLRRVRERDTSTARLSEALDELRLVLAALDSSRTNSVWVRPAPGPHRA